ncbi:MAG: hypothetical protein HC845_15950 [Akkermansiaceae bacterium]|nr:hypothetical protein [Akkermansiaceae bacterium]
MLPILADWLSKQTGGWVLDGFPRSLPQAVFLDQWLAERAVRIDVAILLEVPFNELISRIRNRVECPECRWSGQKNQLKADSQCPVCFAFASSRADDSEENFRSRYAEFMNLTGPVIEHYRKLNLLNPCDATAPQDDVANRLFAQFSVALV